MSELDELYQLATKSLERNGAAGHTFDPESIGDEKVEDFAVRCATYLRQRGLVSTAIKMEHAPTGFSSCSILVARTEAHLASMLSDLSAGVVKLKGSMTMLLN